jgi:hypothetical protein
MSDTRAALVADYKRTVGASAIHRGVKRTRELFHKPRYDRALFLPFPYLLVFSGFVRYQERKITHPHEHPLTHGGRRNALMTLEEQHVVDEALAREVTRNGQQTAKELAKSLNIGVNAMWVHKALKRLSLTHKTVEYHDKNKYTMANLRYYWRFCTRIHTVPLFLLKYMDESHFSARSKYTFLWFSFFFFDLTSAL